MKRRARSGFTLIEVMISLGVMMIGAMAILSLQQHTIRSNMHARRVTIAMQIAQRWVERFKQDALLWRTVAVFNSPNGEPNDATVLANTAYLNKVAVAPNQWQKIPNVTNTISNAFDFQGDDTAQNGSERPIFYCAGFRPAWVYYGRALRVDVRVWWPREDISAQVADLTRTFPNCDDDNTLSAGGANLNNFHVVYLPTVIRVTSL